MSRATSVILLAFLAAVSLVGSAQTPAPTPPAPAPTPARSAPDRGATEGEGPFARMVIRGVTVIDGTGAPPQGPMDVVVEGNRIAEVRSVGFPGVPIDPQRRPAPGTKEIDGTGKYLLPGFVDLHVHTANEGQAGQAEYVYKLWLAHGVTTTRGIGYGPLQWSLKEQERSRLNQIVAPRMFVYPVAFRGDGWDATTAHTPDNARAWVRWAVKQGASGIKVSAHDPDIMAALLDEARIQKIGSTSHLEQAGVGRMNALQATRLGLRNVEHFYGLFESLLRDRTLQALPIDFNNTDEQQRFAQVARLANQVHPRGSQPWQALIDEWVANKVILDPTLGVYSATRDVMRIRNADWHSAFTLPVLWQFFQPSRIAHGSYWIDWTTADEIAWRKFYDIWMAFLNDYKNAGGRVTTGSDSGYMYQTYGFGYIQELEMLQEAGFSPLEVIRAATLHGAEAIAEPSGRPIEFGIIRRGMLADMLLLDENPLRNLKVLYGTGAARLNDATGRTEQVRAIRYTIKDGIVYDTARLLDDVKEMVRAAQATRTGSAAQAPLPGSEVITQQALKADVEFLAADDMRGRLPATSQNAVAADWIRSRFERNGLAPAGGNGSYFFPFEIVAPALDTPNELAVTMEGGGARALSLRDDFYPLRFSATGQAAGEVVFVGFGAAAPTLGYSDYRGNAVRGRIVLALDHDPGEHDATSRFDGLVSSQHGTQQWKTLAAQEAGAAGILFVTDVHNHADTPALSVTAAGIWPVTPPRAETHLLADWVTRIRIPAAQISIEVARQLLQGSGQSLETLARKAETATGFEPMPLPQVAVALRTAVRRQMLPDRNVIAVLPGSDPALRDEVVMVTAHLDHIGATGNEIFNGADDNASGVAGLVAIADAWARAAATGNRPRRSVVFAAWNSEEVGLLGAWAYAERPTFPLARIVAVLNMDMIGRSEEVPANGGPRFAGLEPQTRQSNRNAVNVIGTARSQDLARVVSASNSAQMDVRFRYDNNASNLMRRSDHWPFLQRGVPALWFHTGLHPDYHLPADRAERIEYDKVEAVTRLVFRSSWMLAQEDARPALVAP